MKSRSEFAGQLATLEKTHVERAIAFLWYYQQSQEFEERTTSELAADLQDEGFPKPNVTRLQNDLRRSRFTTKGRRKGTFQLDVRRLSTLNEQYSDLLDIRDVEVSDAVLPAEMVAGTRLYLERIVHQINGSYDYGFYDACGALCRRLMESLIIEVYIHQGRQAQIQNDGVFKMLDGLIKVITTDTDITLRRDSRRTMSDIKSMGDTAAHDRVYLTKQQDIDDVKAQYRRMIEELLTLSGILKTTK
ncbi:MAG: hypothetical protein JXA30_00315 [Deltaproteobacteria bacterium]|nr:hypothetical protein [Deltaproteobacteria bacterium]